MKLIIRIVEVCHPLRVFQSIVLVEIKIIYWLQKEFNKTMQMCY